EGGPAGGDEGAVELRRLQARVHGRVDHGEVALPAQRVQEGAKVREGRVAHPLRLFPIGLAFTKQADLRVTCHAASRGPGRAVCREIAGSSLSSSSPGSAPCSARWSGCAWPWPASA